MLIIDQELSSDLAELLLLPSTCEAEASIEVEPDCDGPSFPSFSRFSLSSGCGSPTTATKALVFYAGMQEALIQIAAGEGDELGGVEDNGREGSPVTSVASLGFLEPIAEVIESSVQQSPIKVGPGKKRTGFLVNESKHWSRPSIPLPKARRTMSEAAFNPPPTALLHKLIVPLPTSPTNPVLPCHASSKDAIHRISPETMCQVLDGAYAEKYDRLIIVDSRYPYEYAGGHLPGAVNLCGLDAAEKFLFADEQFGQAGSLTLVIFHCEFSSERAPRMYHPSFCI